MVEFYRKSNVTKDVPISEIFSDKYGGLETSATIRGGRFSEKYLLEFQVPDDPSYGGGELVRMDLGLYATGLELAENSTAIPKVVAYKVNDVSQSGAGREITEGVGNKKSDDILIYSSQLADYSSVEEVFNGTTSSGPDEVVYEPIQRTLFRKEKPYTTPKMMKKYGLQHNKPALWGFMGGAHQTGVDMSESEIATNYGSTPSDLGILNTGGEGEARSASYSHTFGTETTKMTNTGGNRPKPRRTTETSYEYFTDVITPSSPILILTIDKEKKTAEGSSALYKIDPLDNKAGDTLYMFDHNLGVYHGNRDIIDNETYGNEVTSANSIFEYVKGAAEFIGENKKNEGQSELFGVGAVRFSNKLQRTGGQSCQMYTFWKGQSDDPVTYPRKQSGGPKDRQECLIAKRNIPLPTKFPARPNWDNQDENHFSSTIEIDIYIESLELAYAQESTFSRTKLNGATPGSYSGSKVNMITARRGLAICFSEDAPTGGQSFYDFVADHACVNNDTHAHEYFTFSGDGQGGSTSGAMWSITPRRLSVMDDRDTNVTTAKNFSGALIVMTPEGLAVIPSAAYGNNVGGGWKIDSNTKDVQVRESEVFAADTGLDDLVGKWVRLVFKVTPDGWTCYGPGRQANTSIVSHHTRGIYDGHQHHFATSSGNQVPQAAASHSILQLIDLGSDEIIKDKSLYGIDETDHYRMNNIYVPEPNAFIANGAEFGGNSLQHWPKNLSIWMMNYKNDYSTTDGKDKYLEGPESDTSSSIFIDAVRFNNFNFSVKNCSSKKYNPNAAPVTIAPSNIWAGPDYPKIKNDLTKGYAGEFKTNAPTVLSFGFKNSTDVNKVADDYFNNFTSSDTGTWLLFNGYQTSNLGDNAEIPDCNIRFAYSGGFNGEVTGGATTGTGNGGANQVLKQIAASGDGTYMKDFFVMNIDEEDAVNEDSYYNGNYVTVRAGTGKDQTRKIVASEYKDDTGDGEQYLAVQPQFYNTGGTDSYVAITSHVFGNQFRNECIGSHHAPGKGQLASAGDTSMEKFEKAMFTSRAHSISNTDGAAPLLDDTTAVWDYPNWRYNDVGWQNVGTPNTLDVDNSIGQLSHHGYGTCDTTETASTTTVELQSDMDGTNDAYNGMLIIIEAGTGAGQIREITNYVGSTKVATVNKAWTTTPDGTSKYRLRAAPFVGGFRGGPTGESHQGVSAGTHNNWARKYQNSLTIYNATGSPDGGQSDLQGAEDNNARFESKWFDTGFTEKGAAVINAGSNITLNPHTYTNGKYELAGNSDVYSPIRRYDNLSIGSVGQTGHIELSVSSMPSAIDLTGSNAAIPITSSTELPASIHADVDRGVYNKLPTSINNFNRKGFAAIHMNIDRKSKQPYKRENLAASVRVTEINNPENGKITLTVDNANTLSSDDDEEYIVYLYGQMATMNASNEIAKVGALGNSYEANPYAASGLKISERNLAANTVTFTWDGKANNGDLICTYDNLPALMVSPYRYWVYMVIDCTDESGQKALNSRSYRSVSWMESNRNNMAGYLATGEALGTTHDHANVAGTLAARQNLGSTWNEYTFNDSAVAGVEGAYINEWNLTRMEKGSSLDCQTDYGYGAFVAENNTGGYVGKHIFYNNTANTQTENIMEMPFIVQKGSIEPRQDVTLLLAFEDESLPHKLTLKARNAADSSYDPAIYSVYWDQRPEPPVLRVKPDEIDGFNPLFEWEAADDDLWYGLLHIDNTNISSQYHNMIGHIPLDEGDATTYGGVYFENSSGTKTAAAEGAFSNTREGLAGWAKEFNGTNQYFEFTDATNFATKPSSEMTIVAHAIPDAPQGAQATILAKHTDTGRVTDYEIYIDTDEKINAKITPASGTTLHLKSNSILPRDGQTPVSIIVTFDSNIKGGNMKLFIDGKLEDQSGLMDATGTSSNLKTGQSVNQGTGKFYIGCSANGTTEEYYYDGKIEEIVIYDKCLYPINPPDGKFKLDKPLREVDNGSPVSYQSRLFTKDYHNIRGNKTLDIASSSPVSFAKAGFRLS